MGYGKRPIGVSILAVLSALGALSFMAFTAVALLALTQTTNPTFIQSLKDSGASQWMFDNISLILGATAAVSLVFMIISFLMAFGFWGGRRWAWGLGVVFAAISITYNIANFVVFPGVTGILSVVVNVLIQAIILIYLMMPVVKEFFIGPAHSTKPLQPTI